MPRMTGFVVFCLFCCLALCLGSGFAYADDVSKGGSPLSVAVDGDNAPYTSLDPDGRAFGLVIDMWRLWSRETGIPIHFVPDTTADTSTNLHNDKAAVHAGMFRCSGRNNGLKFSEPFL